MSKTLTTLPKELRLGTFLLKCVQTEDGSTSFDISIPEDEIKLRDDALLTAQEFIDFEVTATNLEECKTATSILKGLDKTAENSRVGAKAPFKESGEYVDELAKGFRKPIGEAVIKLEKAIAKHIEDERKKADDLRKEQDRIEQQKKADEAKKQREAQEELDRLESERQKALAKIENLKTEAARNKARLEALELRNQQDKIEIELAETKPVETAPVVFVPTPNTTGSNVVDTYEFEVFDAHLLYAKFPQFVELVPKKADLLAYIKASKGIPIPGVIIRPITKVSVRAAK